jgi:hypothetical protein
MDPLSVISGVAGVATAGAALSSALFQLIATIRDAPREMIDIAHSIRDLSSVLRELRRILRRGKGLFKDSLFRAVRSATNRIRGIHEDIDELLDPSGGGLARVIWAFRKSKATKLLAQIESHKSTVHLMATTMLLAMEERKYTKYGSMGITLPIYGAALLTRHAGTRTTRIHR